MGLIQLMTIGFAGLYYYVGILLRILWEENRYQRQQVHLSTTTKFHESITTKISARSIRSRSRT